ncbi:GPR1/FUN34/YaaH family transporter [Pseudonocardia sp. RS11V-5]|uniref:GPR1/FUN34/YaaH family transporter n=1 Tax=Pseudonocardia terrae TaxID=2905831 RepID=UPI001E2BF92C|nr:GPR1/FUN34/YaaH family transporter [Pseudonocardia terrae]MCE3550255.1 GPR1/FUN34/YaaH family transporter [Pseudonocardia terrae]
MATHVEGSGTHAVEREELQRDAAAPQGSGPFEVLVGGGGDPLVYGLPIFVAGSLVLGFALIGLVPVPSALGSVLPETTFVAGLGEFVTAVWAILLGQSIVAAIFGLFAGFWFSLFVLLEGVFHNWFVIPTAAVQGAETMFFLAWLIVFSFLTLGIVRLPITYVGIMVFVDLAVLFNLLAVMTGAGFWFFWGGVMVLAFCALGLYAFLNTAWASTGGRRAFPPLGPPVLRTAAQ